MTTQSKISFFTVGNPEGRRLKEMFLETISREFDLNVQFVEGGTQLEVHKSCISDDLVIFDASIEDGHNYAAATAQPMTMDHVLVVSRTYLPLNFYGLRGSGAPEFPHRTTQSNEEIIEWLHAQLSDLINCPPRPDSRKGVFGSFRSIRESLNKQDAKRKTRGQIFLSYRSRYLPGIEKLRSQIEKGDFHGGQRRTVFFLTPGELVYEDEILTEQRHWQLASMIDWKIGSAEELWVYETEDYFDSWWTLAELATVAYRRSCGTSTPKIRLYDPNHEILRDSSSDFLPVMSSVQKRRMARWYANTDPGTMGPEALTPMRFYSQLPLIGRLSYFNDHVWSEEFWSTLLMPCEHHKEPTPRPRTLNLDNFLWLSDPGLVRIPPSEFDSASHCWEITCPICGTPYNITLDPYPRYLWMPVRVGRPTGPDGTSLIELPIYRSRKTTTTERNVVNRARV